MTARLGNKLGKSETLMERWSAEDNWRRVDEYDQFLDREANQAVVCKNVATISFSETPSAAVLFGASSLAIHRATIENFCACKFELSSMNNQRN
jgi:hypothetical protein